MKSSGVRKKLHTFERHVSGGERRWCSITPLVTQHASNAMLQVVQDLSSHERRLIPSNRRQSRRSAQRRLRQFAQRVEDMVARRCSLKNGKYRVFLHRCSALFHAANVCAHHHYPMKSRSPLVCSGGQTEAAECNNRITECRAHFCVAPRSRAKQGDHLIGSLARNSQGAEGFTIKPYLVGPLTERVVCAVSLHNGESQPPQWYVRFHVVPIPRRSNEVIT